MIVIKCKQLNSSTWRLKPFLNIPYTHIQYMFENIPFTFFTFNTTSTTIILVWFITSHKNENIQGRINWFQNRKNWYVLKNNIYTTIVIKLLFVWNNTGMCTMTFSLWRQTHCFFLSLNIFFFNLYNYEYILILALVCWLNWEAWCLNWTHANA